MLIHHTLDVRKLPQKGTSLELTGTSREYRRSNSALRFRWENTIWPVLAKYMEGEDYDTQVCFCCVSISYLGGSTALSFAQHPFIKDHLMP